MGIFEKVVYTSMFYNYNNYSNNYNNRCLVLFKQTNEALKVKEKQILLYVHYFYDFFLLAS